MKKVTTYRFLQVFYVLAALINIVCALVVMHFIHLVPQHSVVQGMYVRWMVVFCAFAVMFGFMVFVLGTEIEKFQRQTASINRGNS